MTYKFTFKIAYLIVQSALIINSLINGESIEDKIDHDEVRYHFYDLCQKDLHNIRYMIF